MRNLKKFLALMLATLMIAGSVVITTGAAKTGADYTDAAHHLAAIGIMTELVRKSKKSSICIPNTVTPAKGP